MRGKLIGRFEWVVQLARRSKKGSEMRGMLIEIRKELMERGTRIKVEREEIMVGKVMQRRER